MTNDISPKKFENHIQKVYREVVAAAGLDGIEYDDAEGLVLERLEADRKAGTFVVPESVIKEQLETYINEWLLEHPEFDQPEPVS